VSNVAIVNQSQPILSEQWSTIF